MRRREGQTGMVNRAQHAARTADGLRIGRAAGIDAAAGAGTPMAARAATIASVQTPAPRHIWDEVVAADRDALAEHTPVWMDAMSSAGRFRDASRLYTFADGRRIVLPLVQRLGGGAPRSSFPAAWGIGGPVGAGLDEGAVSAIMAELSTGNALFTHIRPNPLHGGMWVDAHTGNAHAIPRRAHVLDLRGGADATWERFRKSGRRGVRRAQKAGVEVTMHEGGEMLDVYYEDLYLESVSRWARRQNEPLRLARFRSSRRDPLRKLQAIGRSLGPGFRLYLAWVDGKPAAGNIVLWGPQNAHATRGAINYELANTSRAAYAADWAAIRDSCDAGFSWYQLGESGQNESLSAYKERFGAVGHDYHEYRLERLPLHQVDRAARQVAKRIIGFRDS